VNRLNEIEARANAATEGPWAASSGYVESGTATIVECSDPLPFDQVNAEFIAHARTDVPWLLEKVKLRDKALEAVLEMHELAQPITAAYGTQEGGDYCRTCVEDWPCPTVETIHQHLGDDL